MRRVYLMGYMGAGKTTLGKAYAKMAGLSFIDLDYYLEGRFHNTVRQVFAEKGEDAFRELERRMLHEVAEFEDVVISTGGGTPCFFDNIDFMNATGTTVYLNVSVQELVNRLELCKHTRPVLKDRSGDELLQFVAENLQKREPFYRKASVLFDAEVMLTKDDVVHMAERLDQQLKRLPERK